MRFLEKGAGGDTTVSAGLPVRSIRGRRVESALSGGLSAALGGLSGAFQALSCHQQAVERDTNHCSCDPVLHGAARTKQSAQGLEQTASYALAQEFVVCLTAG